MKHPTPSRAIAARFNDFAISIQILLDAQHTLPALVLLYSAIDVFASLARPETELDTNGRHFKKWAEDYMIGPSQLNITSEELWGARCGLLHTHSPFSKVSRQANVRRLSYYRVNAPTTAMSRALDSVLKREIAKGKLPVDADFLSAAFEDGVRRFLADIQHNSELEKRAVHHASKLFGVCNLSYRAQEPR